MSLASRSSAPFDDAKPASEAEPPRAAQAGAGPGEETGPREAESLLVAGRLLRFDPPLGGVVDSGQLADELSEARRFAQSVLADCRPPAPAPSRRASPPADEEEEYAPRPAPRRGERASAAPRPARPSAAPPGPAATAPPESATGWSWILLSLGLMTFVCGGVLLGWAYFAARGDLWTLGLPLTLAGQAGLLLGLLGRLEALWRSSRETTASLQNLDEQLDDVRRAATLLASTHSTPAQSFYAHLADGASPQVLLTDLKGQLDLLAERMAQQRK